AAHLGLLEVQQDKIRARGVDGREHFAPALCRGHVVVVVRQHSRQLASKPGVTFGKQHPPSIGPNSTDPSAFHINYKSTSGRDEIRPRRATRGDHGQPFSEWPWTGSLQAPEAVPCVLAVRSITSAPTIAGLPSSGPSRVSQEVITRPSGD